MHAPTPQSIHLAELGRRVLQPHIELPTCRYAMIAGSVAEGIADDFSDLDLILHYDAMPSAEDFDRIRRQLNGGAIDLQLGSPAEGSYLIQYKVDGVDCQVGGSTVAQWESEIADVLAGKDPGGPLHKAMYGTQTSMPIFGKDLLQKWQTQLNAYSDALADAMIKHHLKFFRLWRVMDRMLPRDSTLWQKQAMLDSSFNVLGVLAGLNRKYFTNFQFKRMKQFIDSLKLAPPNLAEQLESIWKLDPRAAAVALRDIVAETVGLVEEQAPHIDVSAVKRIL